MAKKVTFKPNSANIAAFLRSTDVQALVREAGDKIADRAGPGFGSQVNVGTRARSTVMAETDEARRSQAANHDIERAIGGGL